MNTNVALAYCNAGFTLLAASFMVAGYRAIRRGQTERHRRCMLSAFGFSAAFLACFVFRYVTFGITEFTGHGFARGAFVVLLVTHEALAVPTVALVVGVLVLGLSRKYELHRELAKLTFPLWLFVSLSGLVIFTLLYLVPIPGRSRSSAEMTGRSSFADSGPSRPATSDEAARR